MPLALFALAVGGFAIGTTEFVIMGLLPAVSDDFGVSIPTAGWLVTGYALGVVVGAPVLTILGTRISRKRMLIALMGIFVIGNLLTAFAPTFEVMVAGRLVASLAHGSFFGIGSVVAAGLVAPDKRARAIAMMFTGITMANLVGVPLGTYVGNSFGWRTTFVLVSLLGVVAMIGVATLVPFTARSGNVQVRREFAAFRNVQVILAMLMTVLGFGGVFATITYIAPMMTDVAGYSEGAVTWLLVLFGLGMVAGNLIAARYADRALMPMLYISFTGLATVLAVMTFASHDKVLSAIGITLAGVFGFATVSPLQKRVLDQASGAPTLAAAVNTGAFNLGNALAAWLGGVVIAADFGYSAPNWVGALLVAGALGIAILSGALERRTETDTAPVLQPALESALR